MIKDYSNVPVTKTITNSKDEEVILNFNNIPVNIKSGESVTVDVKTSEQLAVLDHRAQELDLSIEDAGVKVADAAALTEALADETITNIKIEEDMTITDTIVASHTVTINGNGKTITNESGNVFNVLGENTVLTLDNINVVASDNTPVKVGDKNLGEGKSLKAIIGKDATLTGKYFGVSVFGEGSSVDVYGKISILEDGYCIAGNGLASYAGKTTVNIEEGAELIAPMGFALYLPQDGVVNINGGTLEGASVVGIKAGELNINGGTLKATGELVELPSATYNGKTPTGDVVAIEVNKSYEGGRVDKNIKVNVTGGELTSANAYAIREVNMDSSDITAEVTGIYSEKEIIADNVFIYNKI